MWKELEAASFLVFFSSAVVVVSFLWGMILEAEGWWCM